jgi:hypothetical protein
MVVIGNGLEQSRGGLIAVIFWRLPAGAKEKILNTSVREAGVRAEIGSEHRPSITGWGLLNMNIVANKKNWRLFRLLPLPQNLHFL